MVKQSEHQDSDVRGALDALRQKLLDLSARNRLLNFQHTPTNSVRTVDESPDQLFQRILDGKFFQYAPVPQPTRQELIDYYATEQNVPRAQIPASDLKLPKPEVWAQHIGIEVSYELPLNIDGDLPKHHLDTKIQTLLYPDMMDARLRKLRGDARTAIEETGTNLLYLAFGFLEWRDPRSADKGMLAPLVLVPVELEMTREKGNRHIYRLMWNGEDLQPNLSLQKKLRDDFKIELPDFEEDLTPEGYFSNVRRLVKDRQDWRVRRYVSLSLFQFGKLLLYRDLDPDAWPASKRLESHPVIRKLLTGSDGGLSWQLPPPPSSETIDLELELVDRADSTQAAALSHALSGQSLVVHGPPGTGKSQTITNLIAASIAAGKRVLFVSEKLAALEVVKRRLDELGLGDFVLELHSHKSRKQSLLEDLRRRYETRQKHEKPREVQFEQERLLLHRRSLDDYVKAIGARLGAVDMTVSDVLFECGRLWLRLGDIVDLLPRGEKFDPIKVSALQRKLVHEILTEFEIAVERASSTAPLGQHPWAGLSSVAVLGAPDQKEVLALASQWQRALRSLVASLDVVAEKLTDLPAVNDELLGALQDVSAKESTLISCYSDVEVSINLAGLVQGALGLKGGGELDEVLTSHVIVQLCSKVPDALHRLDRTLALDEAFDPVLQEICNQNEKLLTDKENLEASVRLELARANGSSALRELAGTLRDDSLLRWFRTDWRRAKRQALALMKQKQGELSKVGDILDQTAEFLEAEKRFFSLPSVVKVGPTTLLESMSVLKDVQQCRNWMLEISASLGTRLNDSESPSRKLSQLGWASIKELGAIGSSSAGSSLGRVFALVATDSKVKQQTSQSVWELCLRRLLHSDLVRSFATLSRPELLDVTQALREVVRCAGDCNSAALAFSTRVDLDTMRWIGSSQRLLAEQLKRIDYALQHPDTISDWLAIDSMLHRETEPDVRFLLEGILKNEIPRRTSKDVFDYLLFNGLAKVALEKFPILRKRAPGEQNEIRRKYASADERLMELRARDIAARAARAIIPKGKSGAKISDLTELELIKHEISKQKRHIPIRQLVTRAGKALQALKPCFMMGPLSVAQYLPPRALEFDIAIFDEASQVRPEEALGALGRASQAVIVGDPKQLPPTSFFDRTGVDGDVADNGTIAAEMDSILEAAEPRLPSQMLQWHYRSQHPKLIEFSNARFYEGRLVLFPSPHVDDESLGIRFHYLESARYSNHTNIVEADAIAEAVARHLRARKGESLGVVAMNIQQRELIEQKIDHLLRNEPDLLEQAESMTLRQEPFFVKNLENVQGDERDVIFISMTYGPSDAGSKVLQFFGPINVEAGWRRLNVLFTRSKKRMEIFSSMRESDVTPGETSQRGPRELKEFLRFCETGSLLGQRFEGDRPPGSEFEVAVLEGLAAAGFECRTQIGTAGFYIDIAIVDPTRPGTFVVGIECDGATYHSSQCARDRDRLRQEILERLGWTIERVWSTDWFRNPDRELSRIVDRINAVMQVRQAQEQRRQAREELRSDVAHNAPAETDEKVHPLEVKANEQFSVAAPRASSVKLSSISEADARTLLMKLREEIEAEDPQYEPTSSILRKSMIDELLAKRPIDADEFRQLIREDLRVKTAGSDLAKYGERLFEIIERIGA